MPESYKKPEYLLIPGILHQLLAYHLPSQERWRLMPGHDGLKLNK